MLLWVKAFHLIAVVCWFAMLFYLPRLFVYHAMAEDDISKARFKIMERKLYFGIGTPSMIATVLLGGWTAYLGWDYYRSAMWFSIKMAFVLLLIIYHVHCGVFVQRFKNGHSIPSHQFFRFFNELPVFALIAIAILAVVKQPL